MTGHEQLKFVMTECSKTQIRLTRLILFLFYISDYFFHFKLSKYKKNIYLLIYLFIYNTKRVVTFFEIYQLVDNKNDEF